MSKENINLPKTAFSMKANLPVKGTRNIKTLGQNRIFIRSLETLMLEKKNLSYMMVHHMQMEIFIWAQH